MVWGGNYNQDNIIDFNINIICYFVMASLLLLTAGYTAIIMIE